MEKTLSELTLWIPKKPFGKGRARARAITPAGRNTINEYKRMINDKSVHLTPDMFFDLVDRLDRTFASMYPDKQTSDLEGLIRELFKIRYPYEPVWDGPVGIDLTAVFAVPKSATKKNRAEMLSGHIRPTKKPDWDNIEKIIGDALEGVVWRNDAQIVTSGMRKIYGFEEGIYVRFIQFNGHRLDEEAYSCRVLRDMVAGQFMSSEGLSVTSGGAQSAGFSYPWSEEVADKVRAQSEVSKEELGALSEEQLALEQARRSEADQQTKEEERRA